MIKIVTLINGEQIIGKVSDFSRTVIQITDPYYVMDGIDDDGNHGSRLINVLTLSKEDVITINRSHVVFQFEASDTACAYYEKIDAMNKKNSGVAINRALEELEEMDQRMQEMMKTAFGNRIVN